MSSFSFPTSPSASASSPSPSSFVSHSHRLNREHHQRTGKSKSISSLPAPGSHRNLHRLLISPHSEVPGDLSTSASCPPHKSTYMPASTLSRSSSLRSRHKTGTAGAAAAAAGAVSPSRLPATDAVSYFPPFEDMGSPTLGPNQSACMDAGSRPGYSEIEGFPKIGESSRSGCQADPAQYTLRRHGKGRSLGSLAGFMTASISWGLSSISCGPPATPPPTAMSRSGSIQDGVAVQALSKQFTPGKRRVLESFTVTGHKDLGDQRAEMESAMGREVSMHKRRMRSEVEVDHIVLGRCESMQGNMRGQPRMSLVEDEEMVENMVDTALPLIPRTRSTRRTRPRPPLKLLLPTLPNWRFPLGPSPPVTCLSPDIPLEAFHITIDNPCTHQVSPRHQQSSKGLSNPHDIEDDDEVDQIDNHLYLDRTRSRSRSRSGSLTPSPTTSSTATFASEPSTPLKSSNNTDYKIDIKRNSPLAVTYNRSPSHQDMEKIEELGQEKSRLAKDLGLERTCSRFSERSCETIKQRVWGKKDDITPKPARVQTLTSSSCSR
ncbi:hypothetical protein IAU59_004800 [Kwoniella sp. CBS 9459]